MLEVPDLASCPSLTPLATSSSLGALYPRGSNDPHLVSRQMSPLNSSHTHLHLDVLTGISKLTCFQLNFSSLLYFAELDPSPSCPAPLTAAPFIQPPRLKILRAVPDSSLSFTLHIPTEGEFPLLHPPTPALPNPPSFSPSANSLVKVTIISHFSPRLLSPLLSWFPHCHTCPLTQSSQKPVTSHFAQRIWQSPMARKASTYDTLSCTVCPPPPSTLSFVQSVPVTLDSSLSLDCPKHTPTLDLCTGYSLCLECSLLRYPHGSLLV